MVAVYLHVVAAMAWIGGMIFLVVVFVPLLRDPNEREGVRRVFHLLGRRFRTLGWIALGTLVVTGAMNVSYRGYGLLDWLTGKVFAGTWGQTLLHKLVLVAVILAVSVTHDFYVGPRAMRGGEKVRKAASWLGRATFVMALIVLTLAIQLAR
jgi:putative copper export protein